MISCYQSSKRKPEIMTQNYSIFICSFFSLRDMSVNNTVNIATAWYRPVVLVGLVLG